MKKVISFVTAIALFFTLLTPAFAVEVRDTSANSLKEETVILDGEAFEIRYKEENNAIVYAEVDGSIIERIGDVVYLNGEVVARITREVLSVNEKDVIPRTGWVRSETCPYGKPSEYTVDWGTEKVNIWLKNAIGNLGAATIVLTVGAAIGITFGEAWGRYFVDYILYEMEWADSKYLYSIEHTWHHSVMPYVAKIDCRYFMDSKCTAEVTRAAKTIFASWA